MALACKICIIEKGISGRDLASMPQNEEELFDHIEREHHMPVQRENETEEQAMQRFLAKYPEARNCEHCLQRNAPWMGS